MFNAANCSGVYAPIELSYQTSIIFAILFLITTFSNTIVLISVIYDPLNILKTPFSIALANLATTDLFVGVITDPLLLATHIYEARKETQPPAHLRLMLYFLPSTASVFSLMALTVDRYFAVSSPLKYKTEMSRKRTFVASLAVWLLAGGLCSSYFGTGFIIYHFIFINVAVVAALILYVVLYFKVEQTLGEQRQRLHGPEIRLPSGNEPNLRLFVARQEKSSRTVLSMMGLFLLCYGPSAILIYTMNLCSTCSCYDIHWMRDWSGITVMMNSAIDPILYTYRLPQYKKTVMKILCFKQTRIINVGPLTPAPSYSQQPNVATNSTQSLDCKVIDF